MTDTASIKRAFFTFRNGMVADALRKAGMPYKMIFGLQLPQLSEISRGIKDEPAGNRAEIARMLWNDRDVRESRLLACWLFPADISANDALALAIDVRTREEADILCFRFLRNLPFAATLPDSIEAAAAKAPVPAAAAYCATALRRNLS